MTTDEYREQIAQMSKTMFRYCLSRTNSYHDAEDLAQEILLASFKSELEFPNEKAFYAFVWRTADNLLKSWYRNKSRRETAELDERMSDGSWETLEEKASDNDQLRLITRELSHLNSNYRHVTVAYYIDGMSVKDISERFSLTQSMVKYLLFQSRKRIREGINMEMNYGKLSYDPIELETFFFGGKNNYFGVFDSKLSNNILVACIFDKLSEEQLSLQIGVPTAYLEDELKKLKEYGLLIEKNGFYQSNVPIITKDVFAEIRRANKADVENICETLKDNIDKNMEEVRKTGFYGNDMPQNSLKWFMLALVLHLAYFDKPLEDLPSEYPTDVFGEKCFRLFTEKLPSDPYGLGVCHMDGNDSSVLFWDILINGELKHPNLTRTKAYMLGKLLSEQPVTENEKLICSELINYGFAIKTDDGIVPNIPILTSEQNEKISNIIQDIGIEIGQNVVGRTPVLRKILCDHSPQHLIDYTEQMAPLLHFKEAEQVMQNLCESGWLLPLKDGMQATTIMCLKKS